MAFVGKSSLSDHKRNGVNSEGLSLSKEVLSFNLAQLHPYFITGFSDAESSFVINITKNNKLKTG
jgi:hypothetical protein